MIDDLKEFMFKRDVIVDVLCSRYIHGTAIHYQIIDSLDNFFKFFTKKEQ